MGRALVTIMLLCFTAACGVTSNKVGPEILSSANYGAFPDNYEELTKGYFLVRLKDPFSAQYRIDKPMPGYTRRAPISGGEPDRFGYMVLVHVNAKNGFGGYTGWKPHWLFIVNNNVVSEVISNPWFDEPWYR